MHLHTVALLSIAALVHSVDGIVVRRDVVNREAAPARFPLINSTTVATSSGYTSTRLLTPSTSALETTTSRPSSFTFSLTTEAAKSVSLTDSLTAGHKDQTKSSSGPSAQPPVGTKVISVPNHHSFSKHQASFTAIPAKAPPSAASQAPDTGASPDNSRGSADRARPQQASDHSPPAAVELGNNARPAPEAASTASAPSRGRVRTKHAPDLSFPTASALNKTKSSTSSSNGWYGTTVTFKGNGTFTAVPAISSTPCTSLGEDEPVTVFSIVYTATTTLYGNYSDYTAPYPAINTPNYCTTSSEALGEEEPTSAPKPGQPPPPKSSGGFGVTTKRPGQPVETFSSSRRTVTFVTTDKNPAVVVTSKPPPRFNRPTQGVNGLPVSRKQMARPSNMPQDGNHGQPGGDNQDARPQQRPESQPQQRPQSQPQSQSQPSPQPQPQPQPQVESPRTFSVTARGPEVIINDHTFSDLKPGQTTTATADHGTFTIFPSKVVGEGATVKKPRPLGSVVSAATPTKATIGGVPVVVSGSEAVVGSTTFKLPFVGMSTRIEVPVAGATATVEERPVSIVPGTIVVDDETLTYRAVGAPQTDVIIQGGEMVTASGASIYVFRSTTLTYGPGIPATTQVVDDDTITIGPSGVIVEATTLGGANAKATDTKYQIVGGATVTKVSPSWVIIDGTTFTAGPGAKSTTKVIGGETITIGPSGIAISTTLTVRYPFGASAVTTIKATATGTGTDSLPTETGSAKKAKKKGSSEDEEDDEDDDDDDDDEDEKDKSKDKDKGKGKNDDSGAASRRFGLTRGMTGFCIAIGVWTWIWIWI
ncbi:hypothetical protein LCI18_007674 [Fusarium solani-melongenae]|uniref:Uncharacterized protein n=1 Tax=Fusarium solani subsp. cucurbitae TaxID=2747967 RepID=A0ACD3Z663_FUSSC|nr:hypothetical protein LCI18_007674 [Fusarium solani-melongenae]